MLAFFFSGLLFISSPSFAQSFSAGDQFESQNIRGYVTVFCFGPQQQVAHYRCEQEILKPTEFSYFVGPAAVKADKVELTAIREDGSTKSKAGKYDSQNGRSKEKFNLWVSTLLQKPLIGMGTTRIQYNMTKSGNTVSNGEFSVNVRRAPNALCHERTYNSNAPQDCQNELGACQRYFEDENYCQP
jgi:hypothetical protein